MAKRGYDAFEEYYGGLYGARWPKLKAAMLAPALKGARRNRFAEIPDLHDNVTQVCGEALVLGTRPEPKTDAHGLYDFYFMDPASVFPPAILVDDIQDGERVLDMCAAPGGKTLILAEHLNTSSTLTANEISDRRRARLKAVLHDYVSPDVLTRVRVTGHDGSRWCLHETEAFERVLVDAPCSGERHLLENASEMQEWSMSRSKHLAVRQYALLASALAVVCHGGRLVYSTCSISPRENDDVIRRLLKKREGEVRVRPLHFETGESTEFGWMFLPDQSGGFGPIYVCSMERV